MKKNEFQFQLKAEKKSQVTYPSEKKFKVQFGTMTFRRILWMIANVLLLMAGVLQARTTGNVSVSIRHIKLCFVRLDLGFSESQKVQHRHHVQ